MKKALALMLAFVLVMGTAVVGFDGILALKASAAGEFKLKADASGNFKILQVADIQDSWKANGTVNGWERTVEMIEAAVTLKKPDLIVMTGDNIGPEESDDRLTSRTDFEYSVQRIVDCFHGVPFVVTYGNHDYERNKNGSKNLFLADQDQIYHSHGALTLNQTGLTISSSSSNSTARYGTGYLDVYDSTGTNVIERVIVLNSGNYEGSRSPAQYGRVGVDNDDYKQRDYQNVVNAVNSWTNDANIKCIVFEHIPIQEMFYGDSATTSICKQDANGWSIYPSNTGRIDTSAKYVANTSNPTVSGEFHENAGQAYGSTRELFDALAGKSNVAGLFFGHEHTNTVTGVATIGGKSLRMGYGGGMLVYSDYVGDSAYADCNPLASFYTLNKDYSGVTDTTHFSKDVLNYFHITRDLNNENLYSDNQKYISDVRLFAANTANAPATSGPGHFAEAVANCVAAGYTPIEDTYTQNSILDGANYVQVADFNFDSYSWDAWTGGKAVCIGYKTTTDPHEAITDIRIYDGGSVNDVPATYSNQELWQDQNNSDHTGQNRNTGGTNSPAIVYYNANYDNNGTSLRTDSTPIRFNEGLTALGDSQNAWLFYTKDYRAGLPVKSIFTNITSTYSVAGKSKPFTGTTGMEMYKNLNLNKNNNEYPYSWAQYLHGTVDYARDMAAANVKMNYTNKLLGGDKQTSSWGFIGMTHALPTDEDLLSANVVSTVSPVAVPETVYLTSAASAMTDFQTAVNNVMTISNGVNVALQPADTTMKAYFYLPGATLNSVTLSSGTASMSTKNLTFTNNNGLYSFSADISSDSSYKLSTGLAAGGVGTIKWTFTYDTNKTIEAYTTCYAPYQGAVAGIAASTSSKNGYHKHSASWTAIWGFHEVLNSQNPMYLSGVVGNGDGNYSYIDSTAVYKYTLANRTTTPSNYEGGAAPTTSNLLASDDGSKNAASKSGTTYYYKSSDSNADEQVYVSGGTGLITFDPSRVSTLGDIPNFYFGAYFGSFGGNGDDDKLVNVERNAGFQMIDAAGNYVKTVKDYYLYPSTSGTDPGFQSVTKDSHRAKANDIPLSDGYRFISATYQKWINKTSVGGNGSSVQANACANVLFKAVDKSELRDTVAEALKTIADGNVTDELREAIADASLVLGDPTSSDLEDNQSMVALQEAIISATMGDYLYPPTKFLAPEVVYLNASDLKTFQYFVNDCDSSYTQNIEADNDQSTGYLVFEGPAGATVTGLTCTGATINGKSAGTNLTSSGGFTINGNKVSGTITASTSSLPSAADQKSSTTLTWTVTYTVNARGRNVTQTATAYTECYAPYRQAIATASKVHTNHGTQVIVWLEGVHDYSTTRVATLNSGDSKVCQTETPYYGKRRGSTATTTTDPTTYFAPMLDGVGVHTAGNKNITEWFSASAPNDAEKTIYYGETTNLDNNDQKWNSNMVTGYTALLLVDSSRYTNLNQIPDFKGGCMCPDYTDGSAKGTTVGLSSSFYNGWQKADDNFHNNDLVPCITNISSIYSSGSDKLGIITHDAFSYSWTKNNTDPSTFAYAARVSDKREAYWSGITRYVARYNCTAAFQPITVSKTDKSTLRTSYLNEIKAGRQEAYYTATSWSAYKTALENLAENLECVTVKANNSLTTALSNAIKNLELKSTAVTFKAVGENNEPLMDDITMTVPYTSDIAKTAPAAPEGYQYDGYTVKYNNGTESALNTSADFSYPYSTSDSVVVTFKYSYKSFTLTVDPDGQTYGGSTSITQKVGTTTILSDPSTAPAGYSFDSWVVTGGGSLSGNTYTFGTSDGTATATWAPNTYKVIFDNIYDFDANTEVENQSASEGNGTYTIDTTNNKFIITSNAGNTNWRIAQNGALSSNKITLQAGHSYTYTFDVESTGGLTPNSYIFFNKAMPSDFVSVQNGTEVNPETSASTDTGRVAYITVNGRTGNNTVTFTVPDSYGNATVYFSYNASGAANKAGTLTYSNIAIVEGGNFVPDIKNRPVSASVTYNDTMGGITIPTRAGYVFEGYYTEPGGKGYKYYNADGTSASVWLEAQNTTVYSNWEKIANDDVFVLDASGSVYLNVLDNDAIGATLTGVSGVPAGAAAAIENGKIKFTPGTLINGTVSFTYTVTLSDGNTGSATVKVIPATSIYFEESGGFVTFNGAWTEDKGKDGEEIEEIIAEAHAPGSATYGELGGMYTSGNSSYHSMGTAKKYTVGMTNINKNGTDNAQFTFTGTGFEVYSITNNDCGYFEIDVTGTKENEKGEKLVDLALFDNNYYGYSYGKLYLKDGQITHDTTGTPLYKTTADDKSAGTIPFEDGRLTTNKPSGASQASGWTPVNNTETTEGLYQIPVIAVKNLAYDTYTVKITPKYSPIQDMLYRQGSTDYSFWFDSVKIFDPIDPETITEGSDIYNAYSKDNELFAGSQKIRNILIDKKNVGEVSGEGIGFFTVFDGSNAEAPGVIGTMADIAEYKTVGPNNEVYLEPGKAIGFNITTASSTLPAKVSVGVKMIKPETEGKLTVNDSQEINVSIPTELYREITGINWKLTDGVYTTTSPIVIRNTSTDNVIISLTDIRWSYGEMPAAAPLKAPLRFSFDPNTVTAFASQIAQESAKAASTVEYEGVSIEWTKNEVELGERVSLVITAPEEIVKVTLDGRELSNFEILEDGSKRWTYTVDAAALGGMEYDVVLYDGKGFNSKSLPTGVCKVVEPKVDIADAVISWDKSEISLGETATLSVETSQKIFAVTIGEERITEYTIKDGRKVFALSFTPNELGKYKYTVILEEYHGYTSTSVKSDALTVTGYTVSTDDIDIQWKSGTVEAGAEAELIIRTPADIVKVIVDGHELTESKTLESGEKQWTYAVTVEQTGELEYSIRFIDENGMESSSVSTGALKVEIPAEEPGDNKDDDGKQDEEKLTFWQKLIRFFRNLFSKIVTVVKGLVK